MQFFLCVMKWSVFWLIHFADPKRFTLKNTKISLHWMGEQDYIFDEQACHHHHCEHLWMCADNCMQMVNSFVPELVLVGKILCTNNFSRMSSIAEVPVEIIFSICKYLQMPSMAMLSRASKQFRTIINLELLFNMCVLMRREFVGISNLRALFQVYIGRMHEVFAALLWRRLSQLPKQDLHHAKDWQMPTRNPFEWHCRIKKACHTDVCCSDLRTSWYQCGGVVWCGVWCGVIIWSWWPSSDMVVHKAIKFSTRCNTWIVYYQMALVVFLWLTFFLT